MDHPSLRTLPLELFCYILRWATLVPGAFDTSYASPLDMPLWDPEDELFIKRHWAAMHTKRAISLVSRKWHTAATRYLHEIIILTSKQLPNFASRLTGSAQDARPIHCQTTRADIGHYVRRLHMHAGRRDASTCDALTEIWRQCPNVVVLDLDLGYNQVSHRPSVERMALLDSLLPKEVNPASKLRSLKLHNINLDMRMNQFQVALGRVPSVEFMVVDMTVNKDDPDCVLPESIKSTLPNLHTLEVSGGQGKSFFRTAAGWDLPSLRRLKLVTGWENRTCIFLRRHAPRLQVASYHCTTTNAADPLSCRPPSSCRALEDLIFYPDATLTSRVASSPARRMAISFPQSPSVLTCQGARHAWTEVMSDQFSGLYDHQASLYPNLQVLRLLDAPRWALPKERMNEVMWKFWRTWLDRWEERKVRIEGPGGKVISSGCLKGVTLAPRRMRVDEEDEEEYPDPCSSDSGDDYDDDEEEVDVYGWD